jgi:glycine oxidase
MEVAVIGGGIIGCTIARKLAKAGYKVHLFESDRVCAGTSTVAAGLLAPISESSSEDRLFKILWEGLNAFHRLQEELISEGIYFASQMIGSLVVAQDADESQALKEKYRWVTRYDDKATFIDSKELVELEPALYKADGAYLFPCEGIVDSYSYGRAIVNSGLRWGVNIHENEKVLGLKFSKGSVDALKSTSGHSYHFDLYVLAAGAWSGLLFRDLGVSVPIEPAKGQLLHLSSMATGVAHTIFWRGKYLAPRPLGGYVLGGTEESVGFHKEPTLGNISTLYNAFAPILPELSRAHFAATLTGFRPKTPDGLPIIGRIMELENVIVASGHYRNGILLAAVTAEMVEQGLRKGWKNMLMQEVSPARLYN